MPGASPTSLSLRFLREQGWLAQTVEKWIPTQDPGVKERREVLLYCAAKVAGAKEMLSAEFSKQPAHADREGWNYGNALLGRLQLDLAGDAPDEPQGSPGRRVDLFGLIDILCLDGKPGCLGVQCCAYSGVSAHLKEIREGMVKVAGWKGATAQDRQVYKSHLARRWLNAGNRLSVFGWHKKDGRWTPRIVEITLDSLEV